MALLLALDRRYLLLDEPFTGIEPLVIEKMTGMILREREKGKGILITDHYYRYVMDIIDYAYLLTDGKCHYIPDRNTLHSTLKGHDYLRYSNKSK